MSEIKVKKRDGNVEEWSYDKILNSIGKSMIPLKKAETVASSVEKWVKETGGKNVVSSTEIRDKIIEILKEVDPVAADNYQVYKKT
jgi:transcriptional regulator NrdR family protein